MTDNPGAVVTKLGFPKLFSQAWYQAIKPENLISGFRKTGVCPFNSEAVSVYEIPFGDLFSDDDKLPSENTSQVQEPSSLPVFSDEQISLFDTRYENGYDLCTDEDYVDWVNINHPGFLPTTSDVQIPVDTEPSVSDTLAASRMILSDSPLTDVVDSGSSTLTEPNVSDAIVIPTDTLPKNPTTLLTDISNVSEHQSIVRKKIFSTPISICPCSYSASRFEMPITCLAIKPFLLGVQTSCFKRILCYIESTIIPSYNSILGEIFEDDITKHTFSLFIEC